MRVQQASITSTPKNSSVVNRSILRRKSFKSFEHHEKKKRRKPGTVALKQIKYYQQTTDLLLRALPFARLVREVGEDLSIDEFSKYRWKRSAIEILQHAFENYMVALFEDINKAAVHAKRVTIRPEDMHLVRGIRGKVNPNEMF